MTLKSMTGFGHGEYVSGGARCDVDLSSVNRKQFDLRINLPRSMVSLESRVRDHINASISRGSVSGAVRLSFSDEFKQKSVSIDTATAEAYVGKLRSTAEKMGLKDDLSAGILLSLPDVIRYRPATEDPEKAWSLVKKALIMATKQLEQARVTEGAVLGEDISVRIDKLEALAEKIGERAPKVRDHYMARLRKRFKELSLHVSDSDPAVLKEMVIYSDRSDISEELVRLKSHFKQFRQLMKSAKPAGRALDFLCQEMFREINTTGSKANDAKISGLVIRFKTGLEAVREQVQNVE